MKQFQFEKISIQEISKDDMLLILEALKYTGESTHIEDFLSLRNNILNQLATLSESSPQEFLDYLMEETLSN
ncbi:MAG: hypothetical protein H5T96_04275 [Tissierellales bacterium]|nr:hypothetical protein [Tissierellales bacterium]